MKSAKLGLLRFISLMCLLPGLFGLVASASLSTHYFETMPRATDGERTVPRTINGEVVYLTGDEDSQLDFFRYYGVRAFGVGFAVGLLYLGLMATQLERWQRSDEDELGEQSSESEDYS